jgi:ABC-type histidine transport system ATPase subunit
MSETVIEVSGLTKRYGEALAVDGIDLSVRAGEVIGLRWQDDDHPDAARPHRGK